MNITGGENTDGKYTVAAQDLNISGEAYYQMVIDETPEYVEDHQANLEAVYEAVEESDFIWSDELEPADEGDEFW